MGQSKGACVDELGICVEGKYIWHNLEIQYASSQQQEKDKHFRRACLSPRGIKQWNDFIYRGLKNKVANSNSSYLQRIS
jgi:hypothetical protein